MPTIYVANALFHVMNALGVILSLHRSLCTSVTWVAIGTCGPTCGVHDNRRHHVSRLGSLIGLRNMARFGWRDVSGV